MFNTLITTTQKSTQSYDVHVHVGSLQASIGYEWLLYLLGLVTAIVAIRSFRAARRQNELSTVPIILLKHEKSAAKSTFHLVNLTDRFAYNVRVEPTYLTNNQTGKVYKIQFVMEGKNYIGAKESLALEEKVLEDGAVSSGREEFARIISHLKPTRRRANLIVYFNDSQGVKYFTMIGFLNGSERIAKAPTKLTLFWRLRLLVIAVRYYIRFTLYYFKRVTRQHPDLKTKN